MSSQVVVKVKRCASCKTEKNWEEFISTSPDGDSWTRQTCAACRPVNSAPCELDYCSRDVYALRLCGGHYNQRLKGVELKPLRGSPAYYAAKLNSDGHKQCTMCSRWLPLSEFFARNDAGPNNAVRAHCNKCNILRRMGLNATQYFNLLEDQGFGCAICGRSAEDNGRDLVVDHDHSCCNRVGSCGKCIRGLLCDDCNTGIGRLRDSPAVLRSAADYLEVWQSRPVK